MTQTIERDSGCFCCGAENDRGLHLQFSYPNPGEAETSLVIPDYFSGWKQTTHGGFLSMLLDEIMAHAILYSRKEGEPEEKTAVTAEITVRFKKPVETDSLVRVVGRVVETRGRLATTEAWVYDENGVAAAEGKARFFVQ
jgi:uncharacterized protein (TIGR00369 family)